MNDINNTRLTKIPNSDLFFLLNESSVIEMKLLSVIWNRITLKNFVTDSSCYEEEFVSYKFIRDTCNIKYTKSKIREIIENSVTIERYFLIDFDTNDTGIVVAIEDTLGANDLFEELSILDSNYTLFDLLDLRFIRNKYELGLYFKIKQFSKSKIIRLSPETIDDLFGAGEIRIHKFKLTKASKRLNDLGIKNELNFIKKSNTIKSLEIYKN